MAEYIEREATCKGCVRYGMGETLCTDCVVKVAPAADVVEVKHGKWLFPTMFGYRAFHIPHCSVCEGVPCGVDENTKYCPNCGARMDGE